MERPSSSAPEKKEREPISDAICREAMRGGDFELVRVWYAQQEKIAESDPTPQGHLQLTLRVARLQFEAGIVDEDTGELYAFATLEAAREDAFQRRDDRAVAQIEDIIAEMRGTEKRLMR